MNFVKLSNFILPTLEKRLKHKKALSIFATERAKFEGWLKVEMCDILLEKFDDVYPEKNWIDITFSDWAIELKTANTNKRYDNAKNKNKPITNNVKGVLKDIEKLTNQKIKNKAVLFIVFPIEHKNNKWQSHLKKISTNLQKLIHKEFKFNNGLPGVIYFGLIKSN